MVKRVDNVQRAFVALAMLGEVAYLASYGWTPAMIPHLEQQNDGEHRWVVLDPEVWRWQHRSLCLREPKLHYEALWITRDLLEPMFAGGPMDWRVVTVV